MSRVIRTRGNSYSLDAKNHIKLFKSISPSVHQTKPMNHSRFKTQLKAQPLYVNFNHSQSYIHSKKRKLSLNKATKPNYSVNFQQHLLQQKHEKAKKLLKNGQYSEAIILLQSIIPHVQQSQLQKELYFLLAISNNKVGKTNQTLMLMNLALRKHPSFVDGYLYRGNLYTRLKKYNTALKDFQKALQLDPLNQACYVESGKCYKKIDEIDKALEILQKGLIMIPQSSELRLIIIEELMEQNKIQQAKIVIRQLIPKLSKKNSDLWYIEGLLKKLQNRQSQASICFEECLKYNNSHKAVKQAMHELLKIKIMQRDYYSAFHSANRIEFFNINSELLMNFKFFLEATIMIMRKKYKDGVKILENLLKNHQLDSFILPLTYKFLAYAHFKLNNYQKTIQYYQSLTINQVDDITQYNLYLALGIVTVDHKNNFKKGIKYFEEAKELFPHKVQPSIYIAVTIIKQLFTEDKLKGQNHLLMILKALSYMNQGYIINSSSSNLLFHRTIIHFYLQNWQQAYKDINNCIQKAQQNLPKYFYIRGLCNACVKDFAKAINQYSICLSLNSQFTQGYLQRAKCQFLTGQTQNGFRDLKKYMQLNPQDLHVHKWIGDLLYEGRSYKDALRAYQQINDTKFLQLRKMKARCLFRLGDIHQLLNQLKIIQKNIVKSDNQTQITEVDYSAVKLINCLLKQQINLSSVNQIIKTINTYLQKDKTGHIFQLIDCMGLLGVAAFYIGKYDEAYQSFALVLQLFQSSSQKYSPQLKSECSQETLDLQFQKIVYNMLVCKIMSNQWDKAATILKQEIVQDKSSTSPLIKQMINLSKFIDSKVPSQINIQPNESGSMFRKFKKIQTQFYSIKLKTRLFYGLYHDTVDDLYSTSTAKHLIQDLKPSYIDNMPEGPWIKRNQFGVIFTEQLLVQDQSSILDSSVSNSIRNQKKDAEQLTRQKIMNKKKEQFLNLMKLDKSTEQKLNKLKQK